MNVQCFGRGQKESKEKKKKKKKSSNGERTREEKENHCPFLLDTLSKEEQKKIMLISLLYILLHLAGSLVAFDTTSENYTVPVSGKCILSCYVTEVRSFKVSYSSSLKIIYTMSLSSLFLSFLYLCLLQYDLLARRNCTVCWFNKLVCVCVC
jgi:hypothetical protein